MYLNSIQFSLHSSFLRSFSFFFFISFTASIRSTSEPLVRSSGRPQGCWNRDTWSYKNGKRIQLFLFLLLLATSHFFSLLVRFLFISLYLHLIFIFSLSYSHTLFHFSLNLYLYFLSLYSFTHTLSVFSPLCLSISLSFCRRFGLVIEK